MNNIENEEYINHKIVVRILEEILDNDFDMITERVKNANIMLDEEDIMEYLNELFKKEYPDVRERINKHSDIYNTIPALLYEDSLIAKKYQFNPYTLVYFKKHIEILKKKCLSLLSIIETIGHNKSANIKDILNDLDITIDDFGNIYYSDLIRLIKPTVHNLNKLNDKVSKANNITTYSKFRISKDIFNNNELSEEDIYPSENLQIKSLEEYYTISNDNKNGYIPLSKKQIKEMSSLNKQKRK